jgi:butyrate kinase
MTKILAINPGSTSTKIAVFEDEKSLFETNISHSVEELEKLKSTEEQFKFRKDLIISELADKKTPISDIDIIIARGGLLKPIESGIYQVNGKMLHDLINAEKKHASNLGALIADELSKEKEGLKAYIADPVVVDELEDVARYSGHPAFERISVFHALNQKAISRSYADESNEEYENLNLIVVHMGGGVSVGAHCKGKVIDVNQALDGEGPFSPERSGTLPIGDVIRAAYSGKYSKDEMLKMVVGKGGFSAYTGSNDAYAIELKAQAGDEKMQMLYKAMAHQVAKEIGAMATVLKGEVDQILLTGGMAKSAYLNDMIKEKVSFIAGVSVYPGEDEMKALASNALLLNQNKIQSKTY